MATVKKEYFIAVPPRLVWEALTDATQLEAWGAGPNVLMELTEGGAFSLWDGDITGTNLDFEPEQRLVQQWNSAGYDYPTEVTIALEPSHEEEDGTAITVTQTDVKEEDVEEFDRGWDEYYFGPLKEFCEAGGIPA
jgi:uncharacterized protein YndB with AHSA1/START domain